MSLTKEQVLEKLQKILARAQEGKGNSESEMNLAMAKAKALAMEYGIDLASVKADGKIEVEGIETDFANTNTKTKQEQPYHLPILWAIRDVFEVHYVLSNYTDHNAMRHITNVCWIGEKVDVAMAVYCWGWLQDLFPKRWLEYRKAEGIADNYVSKREYFKGLSEGIRSANRRQKASLPTDLSQRYALVLVKKEQLVKARKDSLFPPESLGNVRSFTMKSDDGSYRAGVARGKSIKLNGGITNGTARPSLS